MIKEAHFMKFKNGKLKAFMTTNNLLYHSITFTTFYPTSDNNVQVLFSKLQKSWSRWTNTKRKCIKLLLNGLVWFLVCCSVNRGQHNISRLITNKKFQLLGVTALHSKISNGTSAAVSRLRAAQLHVVFISRNNDSILNLSFPVHPVHFALAFQTISKDYPQLFKIDWFFDFQCHWIRVFFFFYDFKWTELVWLCLEQDEAEMKPCNWPEKLELFRPMNKQPRSKFHLKMKLAMDNLPFPSSTSLMLDVGHNSVIIR